MLVERRAHGAGASHRAGDCGPLLRDWREVKSGCRSLPDQKHPTRLHRRQEFPPELYDQSPRQRLAATRALARSYDRICFERSTLEADVPVSNGSRPVTRCLRLCAVSVWEYTCNPSLRQGAVFYELEREQSGLLELFIASV
jgi:hypothetical protein